MQSNGNVTDKTAQQGHLAALFTVLVWGTTYISTKYLLHDFRPVELLTIRFIMGYCVLWILHPHRLRSAGPKEELMFLAAGLSGVTVYYLLENTALQYTLASNVGVVITVAPFFTAMLSKWTGVQGEEITKWFYIGFAISMTGLCLLSFGGSGFELHLLGDFLGLAAAFSWADVQARGFHIPDAPVQVTVPDGSWKYPLSEPVSGS